MRKKTFFALFSRHIRIVYIVTFALLAVAIPFLIPVVLQASAATSTPNPPNDFSKTLAPGTALPSEKTCTASIKRYNWEPRQDNVKANHTVPTIAQIKGLVAWGPALGMAAKADTLRKQITGNFTGTTDEILRWAACKWGVDENIVRAEAIQESFWHNKGEGDWTTDKSVCPPGTWNGTGCNQSYGILQIQYRYYKDTWPMSRNDTAFNAEYVYGELRACFEGWTTYLRSDQPQAGYPRYHAGDMWGCVGRWYSGHWYDQGAISYIGLIKRHYAVKEWLDPNFSKY